MIGCYVVLSTFESLGKADLGGAFEQELTALYLILHLQQVVVGRVEVAVNMIIKV